jgi:hypothetical protein
VASIVNSDINRNTPTAASAPQAAPESNDKGVVSPGSWLPFPESFEQRVSEPDDHRDAVQQDAEVSNQFIDKIREIHNFGDEHEPSHHPPNGIFQGSHKNEQGIENETVKIMVANGQADSLLNEYRAMCASFPFVPLSATITASDLHTTKPMLFLAIITVTSWKDRLRQRKLDRIYRTELASRTIVTPRKTVSLVQSILVYLSR